MRIKTFWNNKTVHGIAFGRVWRISVREKMCMKLWNGKLYSAIIGYGAGMYYEKTKKELARVLALDYLCDRKWEDSDEREYDGIPLVRIKELQQFDNVLLVVFASGSWRYDAIKKDLDMLGMEYVHVNEIIRINTEWSGKLLKEKFPDGYYEDTRKNKIHFDDTIPEQLSVLFIGDNNTCLL